VNGSGLKNQHAFHLGDVTLVGLAVGESKPDSVASLATSLATSLTPDQDSCTFYYNDGNDEASARFNHYNLPKPIGDDFVGMTAQYTQIISKIFDTATPSFLSCANTAHYIAMGCDGMKHRGPTVFAATLAYSGCSPQHATDIVDSIWGTNGIKPEMRVAITTWAASVGAAHPTESAQLRAHFLGQPPPQAQPQPAPQPPQREGSAPTQ
jgi:hypothetical protein